MKNDNQDNRQYVDAIRGRGAYTTVAQNGTSPIILISADMISPDMYGRGRYADLINTPNLDRLRGDGVWFRNAFCNSPLCGPSRASYLTGRYTYLTVNEERAHDGFATELRPDDVIFPEYLRSAGYRSCHVGKCHVGTKKFMDAFGENDSPWNRWAPPVYDDDAYLHYRRDMGVRGMKYDREIRGLKPDGKTPGNSYGGWVVQEDGSPFPIEATYPCYLAHRAAETLRLRTNDEAPLYLQLDFFAPHQPFFIPAGLEERESELRAAVELPDHYDQIRQADFTRLDNEPYVYEMYRRHWGLYDEESVKDYMVAHLLQMEVLDHALGSFLDALEANGMYEEALIAFLGDHGEMNGHGALIDKGVYGHPRVEQVPLFLKKPGNERAGEEVTTSVCLLDIAPTLLDSAGIMIEDRLDGESLLPFAREEKANRDKPFIFESGWHVTSNPAVSVQKHIPGEGHFLYTYNVSSPQDELYDLNDPSCIQLSGDPDYRDIEKQMIRHLGEILSSDRRWRCYWHSFQLEKQEVLKLNGGDTQMFIPE